MIKISDTEYFSNDKTIRFLNMDCNVFMAGCKENEFDLNLSDPPYGCNWGGVEHLLSGDTEKTIKLAEQANKWDIKPTEKTFNFIKKTACISDSFHLFQKLFFGNSHTILKIFPPVFILQTRQYHSL